MLEWLSNSLLLCGFFSLHCKCTKCLKTFGMCHNGATQTYQKGPAKCIHALRIMLIGTSAHIRVIKVNL